MKQQQKWKCHAYKNKVTGGAGGNIRGAIGQECHHNQKQICPTQQIRKKGVEHSEEKEG